MFKDWSLNFALSGKNFKKHFSFWLFFWLKATKFLQFLLNELLLFILLIFCFVGSTCHRCWAHLTFFSVWTASWKWSATFTLYFSIFDSFSCEFLCQLFFIVWQDSFSVFLYCFIFCPHRLKNFSSSHGSYEKTKWDIWISINFHFIISKILKKLINSTAAVPKGCLSNK